MGRMETRGNAETRPLPVDKIAEVLGYGPRGVASLDVPKLLAAIDGINDRQFRDELKRVRTLATAFVDSDEKDGDNACAPDFAGGGYSFDPVVFRGVSKINDDVCDEVTLAIISQPKKPVISRLADAANKLGEFFDQMPTYLSGQAPVFWCSLRNVKIIGEQKVRAIIVLSTFCDEEDGDGVVSEYPQSVVELEFEPGVECDDDFVQVTTFEGFPRGWEIGLGQVKRDISGLLEGLV